MKNSRIEEEKKVVEQMIRLYCHKKEGNGELCQNCHELLDYAHSRLDRCRYGEEKPTCKKCPVHCYRPDMKERVRAVMRIQVLGLQNNNRYRARHTTGRLRTFPVHRLQRQEQPV